MKLLTNFYWLKTNLYPNFIYGNQNLFSSYRPFTNHRERIQKFKELDNLKHVYKKELEKACFDHDGVYSGIEDLARKTNSDKILKKSPYDIALNPKYDGYQRGLASIIYKFF